MVKVKKYLKNSIKQLLLKQGFRVQHVAYFNFLDSLMQQLIRLNKPLTILQIGANDGKRFDPINEFIQMHHANVHAHLIEPISDYYADLVENYKHYANVRTYQMAIHNTKKKVTLYKLKKSCEHLVPELAKGIASIHKDHYEKTRIPKDYIDQEQVNAISLPEFIEKNAITSVDVLVCDVEGYDFDILNAIDFNVFKPKIIHFEHGLKLQTMTDTQFKVLSQTFQNQDYQLYIDGSDVTAYQSNIIFNYTN